ncbi:hypothetical protein RRSWK_02153 [Rhodopirellula sp. SWK7]|nr:hypothetical protein RRSWK_02153 [Rhodopirellula sp. SWK7]
MTTTPLRLQSDLLQRMAGEFHGEYWFGCKASLGTIYRSGCIGARVGIPRSDHEVFTSRISKCVALLDVVKPCKGKCFCSSHWSIRTGDGL